MKEDNFLKLTFLVDFPVDLVHFPTRNRAIELSITFPGRYFVTLYTTVLPNGLQIRCQRSVTGLWVMGNQLPDFIHSLRNGKGPVYGK